LHEQICFPLKKKTGKYTIEAEKENSPNGTKKPKMKIEVKKQLNQITNNIILLQVETSL